ncbi:MAG: SDR family NAD(P)-dependent oxidoreductase [Pseudomonadota bacterium]
MNSDSANTSGPSLNGHVALVTGASRGIGAATAQRLAADGAEVYLADLDNCAAAVAAIEGAGGRATGHVLDVRERDACQQLVDHIVDRSGSLSLLVANAGVCPPGRVAGDWDQWREVLDVNLNGTQHCVAAAWEALALAQDASVVLVSSMAFYLGGVIVGSEYSASKGALIGLTRHLARNGGPQDIRCNAVAPGIIETPMIETFKRPPLEQIPLRRYGSAEDVAGPIRFLCGPDAAYLTGTVLNVTGGMVLAA